VVSFRLKFCDITVNHGYSDNDLSVKCKAYLIWDECARDDDDDDGGDDDTAMTTGV
jgi:hypothetical protein